MHRSITTVAIAMILAAVSSAASAQSIRLDRYLAAERGSDGFATRRLHDFELGIASLQVSVDYAHEPLVLEDSIGADVVVVEHELVADLAFGIALSKHVFLFIDIDAPLWMEGDDIPVGVQSFAGKADGAGIGDVRPGARFRLIGDEQSVVRFGFDMRLTIPLAELTEKDQSYRGEGSVAFDPRLLLEFDWGAFGITANAGVRLRDKATWTGTEVGSEVTYALAFSLDATDWLTAYLEGHGALGFSDFGESQSMPLEGLLGLKAYGDAGFGGGIAGGTGIIDGFGTPDLRVIAQIGYAPRVKPPQPEPEVEPEPAPPPPPASSDRDGDGLLDPADRCPDEAEDKDAFEDEDGCPDPDNDKDGIADAQDQCRDQAEDKDAFEDEDGCPDPDNDKDGIADGEDGCPDEPGDAALQGCPAAKIDTESKQIEIREQIQFETGKDALLPESDAILDAVRKVLEQAPQIKSLRVEGHTDDVGKPARNLDLSKRRARSVVKWLIGHGVDPARLQAWGCGDTVPAMPNDSAENRALNRRVVFALAEMEGSESSSPPAKSCRPAK